jgi:hypothetical protein
VITRLKQPGNHKKEFSMKKYIRLFGIIVFTAVIGFSFISCDEGKYEVENTVGRLTITGLDHSSYQYIIAFAGPVENPSLTAAADILTDGSIIYGNKSGNQVTLKVWRSNDNLHKFTNYNGTEINVIFHISCKADQDSGSKNIGFVKVNFYNGIGTAPFTLYW